MSGLRNRRVVDRDAEATDLFSSSMIFGNAGAGVGTTFIAFKTVCDGDLVMRVQPEAFVVYNST